MRAQFRALFASAAAGLLCISSHGQNIPNSDAVGADRVQAMHWAFHTEVTLDRPLGEAWSAFRDMRGWYTKYKFEVLSGPAYQAGSGLMEDQVLRLTSNYFPRASNADGDSGPHYFVMKTIEILPQREIVAVLSGPAYDWKQYCSVYVWRMSEESGRTTVFVDAYGDADLTKPMSKEAFGEYREKLRSNWHQSWNEAFGNLKRAMHLKEETGDNDGRQGRTPRA